MTSLFINDASRCSVPLFHSFLPQIYTSFINDFTMFTITKTMTKMLFTCLLTTYQLSQQGTIWLQQQKVSCGHEMFFTGSAVDPPQELRRLEAGGVTWWQVMSRDVLMWWGTAGECKAEICVFIQKKRRLRQDSQPNVSWGRRGRHVTPPLPVWQQLRAEQQSEVKLNKMFRLR